MLNPTEWILSKQEAIFQHYLRVEVGKSLVRSPFRVDKNPTCGFYYNSSGILKLHDFATDEFFSAIDIVKKLFSLSYPKAIDKILADKEHFGFVDTISQVREEIEWTVGDPSNLSYFNRYKVITTDILLKYKVFSAKNVVTNSYVLAKGHKANPLFVYIVDDKIKWYKPLSKDKAKKWGGTTNSATFFGFSQLPKRSKLLLITSSLKDVMVLRGLGFNAIALNAESYGSEQSNSGKELKKKLTNLEKRFEHIVFYMNNDEPGIKFNTQLAYTYRKKYIQNPIGTPKDISDYIEHYGITSTYRMLKKQISHILNTNRNAYL